MRPFQRSDNAPLSARARQAIRPESTFDLALTMLLFFEFGTTFPEYGCAVGHVTQNPYIYAPFSNLKRV